MPEILQGGPYDLARGGWRIRQCLARILLAAPRLLAGDAVDHPGVPGLDCCVDGGHHIGHGGLDHLALLHKVAGGAVTTLPHTFTLSHWDPGAGEPWL